MSSSYRVCIPHTKKDYFDYEAPLGPSPCVGARVWVPFRQKTRLGIVIAYGSPEPRELKKIAAVIDEEALISEEILSLCTWIAGYYQSPLSEVLALALPQKYRQGMPAKLPVETVYQLTVTLDSAKQQISSRALKQLKCLDFFSNTAGPICSKRLAEAGFNKALLLPLLSTGIINQSERTLLPPLRQQLTTEPLSLHPEQAIAVDTIRAGLGDYHCFLLQGVTGSGKTEVYLQVIDSVLKQNKQILILVPEIGLTPQLLARFSERFNACITVLHSNLNESARQLSWQLAKTAQAKILIGTRSAVFTPLPDLGLIIIDEEHDSSFKQMDGVRYSARDTAMMRAYKAKIPIILGSATPSLESLYNCEQKKYQLLRLTQKALTNQKLHYDVIDLRAQTLQHGLSQQTLQHIETHLKQNNQILVFINRRGFSPVLLCHQCGWMADCPACDSHLTFYKKKCQLICHHCGFSELFKARCPQCQQQELIPVGAGTQRIHEFLSQRFPDRGLLRIDRDETQRKQAFEAQLERIHRGEVQLIVGTQMLAKGHHFPRLSLVVILDADVGFFNQDFKALEQLGQLIIQVSGRAGRAEYPGQVVIQTHHPKNPLLKQLIQEGYEGFASALLASRQQAELPPFHYLAVLRAEGKTMHAVLEFLHQVKTSIQDKSLSVLGPAPAPLARKAHRHRMQLCIKSPSRTKLNQALTVLRSTLGTARGIHWSLDVDPMDLS